jgi:hypothetical protein
VHGFLKIVLLFSLEAGSYASGFTPSYGPLSLLAELSQKAAEYF